MTPFGNPLFRQEVLDARRQGWLGTISLAQPLRWRVLAGVAIALASAALCVLFFGTYSARSPVVGELTASGGHLQARLTVPSRAIGSIAPGDRILLRIRAFPYQKFGLQAGRVTSISARPVVPAVAGGTEPAYRVFVELEKQAIVARGESMPLRAGMRLDADVPGERRRLYQWVLQPLLR